MNGQGFWKLQLKINFQDEPDEKVRGNDYGLGDKYYFSNGVNLATAIQQSYNLIAARASLLGVGCKIVKAVLSDSTICRSQYKLPGFAKNPVFMNFDALGDDRDNPQDEINQIQDAFLLRSQTTAGRRWTRTIRGVRDRWMVDQDTYPSTFQNVYGDSAALSAHLADYIFPDIIPVPLSSPSVEAVFGATLLPGGVLSALTRASAGTYVGAVNGVYPLLITDASGQGGGAKGTATITSGAVSAQSLTDPGAGYVNPIIRLPAKSDVNGLNNYQSDTYYLKNFLACLGAYEINFHPATVPDSNFPSGKQTIQSGAPSYTVNLLADAIGVERTANRQTGKIWVKSKGRKKVAI